jgi:tetratricopeptide (TPR) repeat protein
LQIKYSKKKQELRRDPVIDAVVKGRQYVSENSSTLLSVVVIALLVLGGFGAYIYVKRTGRDRAIEAFGKAMIAYNEQDIDGAVDALSMVVEKHRSAPQAAYAAYMLGHILFAQGKSDEAMSWFEIAADHKKAGFIAGEALEAMALCYEVREDFEMALDFLSQALKAKSVSYRYPALHWKSALLCRQSGDYDCMRQHCEKILSDTLAVEYQQKAKNLLAETEVL